MKDSKIKKIIASLSAIQMSSAEKSTMERELLVFSRGQEKEGSYTPLLTKTYRVFAFSALAFLIIASVSKPASAKAVPGEFLYPIKIMYEEIESITKNSADDKINHEIERAQERIEEATILVKEENFDLKKQAQLAHTLTEHTSKLKEEIKEIRATNPVKALELTKHVQNAIQTNSEVLRKLSVDTTEQITNSDIEEETPQEDENIMVVNELDVTLETKFEREEEDESQLFLDTIEAEVREVQARSEETENELINTLIEPITIESSAEVTMNENESDSAPVDESVKSREEDEEVEEETQSTEGLEIPVGEEANLQGDVSLEENLER